MTYNNIPLSVTFSTDTGVHNAIKNGDIFEYETIRLTYDNGRITIESPSVPLNNAIVTWETTIPQNALIFGDEWERSYATLGWRKPADCKFMPWYFLTNDGTTTTGYGVMVRPSAMCCWTFGENTISLTLDLRCGCDPVELGDRTLEVCTVVTISSEKKPFYVTRDFCAMMCSDPVLPKYPIYGGNDWYCCYGNNSYQQIITHAERIAECAPDGNNRPIMVVDDGWQLCRGAYRGFIGGPWVANKKFSENKSGGFDAMKTLAGEISDMKVRPGIWIRPLQTAEYTNDISMKNNSGKYLDPSTSGALSYIFEQIERIHDWGYQLLKHDFSTFDITGKWGGDMGSDMLSGCGHMKNRTLTTSEIIINLYKTIRKAAGDMEIIGCNVIGHLSAGIFHAQRIGDDTSGNEWERTVAMGVNTLAYRLPQHNTFFAADADCVGITTRVPWENTAKWLKLLSISGTPLLTSIAADAYNDTVREALTEAFKLAASADKIAEPVDFTDATLYKRNNGFTQESYDCMVPSEWVGIDGKTYSFKWF